MVQAVWEADEARASRLEQEFSIRTRTRKQAVDTASGAYSYHVRREVLEQ